MKSGSMLCLNKFYPEKDLKIVDIGQQKDKIVIRMKSISKTCSCPKCNCTEYTGALKAPVYNGLIN